MAPITINGVSLDPLAEAQGLAAAGLEPPDASQSNYVLVQTGGPLTAEQRGQLEKAGAEVQEYVPESTYLCRYAPADLQPLRDLPFVALGRRLPARLQGPAGAAAAGRRARRDDRPRRRRRVLAVAVAQAARGRRRPPRRRHPERGRPREPHRRGGPRQPRRAPGRPAQGPRAPSRRVSSTTLAALDEVRHIEPVPERQLFNNVARPIIDADVVVNGTHYQGDGEIVAVADTGFDKGSTPTSTRPSRGAWPSSTPSAARAPTRPTTRTGTARTSRARRSATATARPWAARSRAPRPGPRSCSSPLLDSGGGLGGIPLDLHDLFEPPYDRRQGPRAHELVGRDHAGSALRLERAGDRRLRLEPTRTWSICFAAGNDGIDKRRQRRRRRGLGGLSESAAKNAIIVGASESDRPDFEPTYGDYWPSDFPKPPINDDQQANNPDGMAAFSSRGPTQEGRIKPDVVAPGTCILSTLSRNVASAVRRLRHLERPGVLLRHRHQMATPLVAGCCAVLRETLVKNGMADAVAPRWSRRC